MSNLSAKSNVDNVLSKQATAIDVEHIHLSLAMEKSRSRLLLCSEVVQILCQSENVVDSLLEITKKILNLLHAAHVSIYQLEQSIGTNKTSKRNKFRGKIVAEAIAPYYDACSRVDIKNILLDEYRLSQSITDLIIDRYTTGTNRWEVDLAEIFTGKAYLLVPIVISEGNATNLLWGFLTVHQCTGLENGTAQSRWDQDDVLMLQQIAMQIEMSLQKIQLRDSLLTQLQEADQAYTILYRWTHQYRSLVEQIPSVSYVLPINNNAELAYISPQMQELLGVPASEWNAGFLNTWADYIHPDDRDHVYQDVRQTIATEAPFCCEYRMIKYDGTVIWVRDTARIGLAVDGETRLLRGSAFDISDRKLTEAKLDQNKNLLNLTIANVPVGIATFNLQSEFLTVNRGFCKIFGYTEAELLKMTVNELTHPNSMETTLTALYRLLANEVTSIKVEKQYTHKKGHAIDVISRFGLVRDENDKPIQFVVGVEDVTERKQTEAKLAAAQVAESANKAKSEFLAVMSHELRTPMNAVIGMTEILENTPLSPQQQQYVSTIRNGGQVLLSVINNILDFSRIESGQFELEVRPFKLEQCIEEVLDLMTSRTAEKSLELSALINSDVPQQFLGDYNRLRQILVNLVSNAIKFTEAGEIAITVDARLIKQETNTYELLVDVRDTGVGIAPEAISRLFKAFSQADSSIARQYGGTGLGLAICKQLCELMGGEIWVNSTVGKGSTFSFKIVAESIPTEPMPIAPELKGKRILIINSNSTIQEVISIYAQAWKLIPQCAYSPTEALQLLSESTFDVVLIDVQMVDSLQINALELAQSIQEVFPDLKLVLLTSVKEIGDSLTVRFADYITKPISASKIYQSLVNVFTLKAPIARSHYPSPQKFNKIFSQSYPFRVLVAEDNPVNQQVLLLMLENLGCHAESVENGQKAIASLERNTYDVIFMDIQMPIMDGVTATKGIRQLTNRHPWIIGLSANAFVESRESALLAGMNDYLTKPLQVENLIAALQKVPQQRPVEYHAPPIITVNDAEPVLDLSTLANLEDSIGSQNLDELILVYLEHSQQAINTMKEAFKERDIIKIESENHALKGGSGTFGATKLLRFCQSLQSLCRTCLASQQVPYEHIEQIGSLLRNIEEEYSYLAQAFQLRNY